MHRGRFFTGPLRASCWRGVVNVELIFTGGGRGPGWITGRSSGGRRSGGFQVVEDARAGLAVKHFVAAGAAHLLKHVRANAHAAGAALFVAHFGEGDIIVFLHDAIVVVHHVFGNFGRGARAFGISLGEFFFRGGLFLFDFSALAASGFFHFLQGFFGGFDFAVIFFAGHHLLEQAVFGFGDFVLGVLHFVLQRFVRFVGFHLGGLIFVLAHAVFPLLHVQLVFLAVFYRGELRGFALVQFCFSGGDAAVYFRGFFGQRRQARPHNLQARVHALQVEQIL